MNRGAAAFSSAVFLITILGAATPAHAQWYFVGFLGANRTAPANVDINVPASNVALTFQQVEFDARPFESPQYYGWRLGRIAGTKRGFGVEAEFIHLKVIGLTNQRYATTGTSGSAPFTSGDPMTRIVDRYAMTHGLNFLVANAVFRQPLGSGRAAFIARVGAGITIPHTETTVLGGAVDQYEYGGAGLHAAIGLDVQLRGRLSFVTEYKLTRARPEISIANGAGVTTAVTHHLAFGLAFGLSR